MVGTVTFSAKKIKPKQWGTQYAVGTQYTVGAKKVNSHSLLSKYGWWGPLPLVQKGQTPCSEDEYAVGVGAKGSTHTVYFLH